MAWKPYTSYTKKQKEVSDELVRRGNVSHLLTPKQREFYALVEENKIKTLAYYASRRCLPEGTLVKTPHGAKEIESLRVGDLVLGVNEDGSVTPTEVLEVFDQGEQTVFPLTCRGRVVAEATENHVFKCRLYRDLAAGGFYKKRGESSMPTIYRKDKTVKELRSNRSGWKIERVLIDTDCEGKHVPTAYALGAFLGDGCCRQGITVYHLSSNDPEIPEKVAKVIGANSVLQQNAKNYTWLIGDHYGEYHGNRRIFSKPELPLYAEWCEGRYAHEKIIDWEEVKTWDSWSMRELLAGLLDTDGSVGIGETGKGRFAAKISFCSGSTSLVEGVKQLIYVLFGYVVHITKEARDKYVNTSCMYLINLNSTLHAKRIAKALEPHMVCKRKKYSEAMDKLEPYNSLPDYIGVKVGDKGRLAKTYDIRVANKTSHYLLHNEGLVTHNSGKTWGSLLMSFGLCLKHDRLIVRFILDTLVQAKDVLWPIVRDLQDVIPKDVFPAVKKSDLELHFPNGSVIKFGASNKDHSDKLRGSKSDICFIDEAGFHDADQWEYVVYSLLMPQMLHSKFGQIIYTTTPPDTVDHPFITHELPKVTDVGGLITSDIHSNVFLTQDKIEEVQAAYRKGKDDLNYKREHELVLVVNQDRRVVPEFDAACHVYDSEDPFAPLALDTTDELASHDYLGYVVADVGVLDNTAIVFYALDWRTSTLYAIKECILRGRGENYLSNFATSYQEMFDYASSCCNEVLGLVDCFEQLRNSLVKDYGICPQRPSKGPIEGSIGLVRAALDKKKILVHSGCKQLIRELEGALWKTASQKTKEIERSDVTSHFDAGMTLCYCCKRVNWTRRPSNKLKTNPLTRR